MKVHVLKWQPMDGDEASIQIYASQRRALEDFENDGLVETHPSKAWFVRQLFLGYPVDIDNQTTVTLEEMEVTE